MLGVANDDITAVIACFNHGRYLREAVDSVLAQGARVVVVDDGSTDADTHAVLERCRARCRWCVRRTVESATPATPAWRASRRPTRSCWTPTTGSRRGPRRSAGAARRGPAAWLQLWDDALFRRLGRHARFPDYNPYRLLHRHTIGLSALMRRELVEDTGGFDPAFEHYEDWELWLNALAHGLARALR